MSTSSKALLPLKGTRILSLSLNLPGPAALMRCRAMGATCVKLEPPARAAAAASPTAKALSADPMLAYCPGAYAAMHPGVRCVVADLKADAGQKALHRELLKADILLTSFRPSGLAKLGLSWKALHSRYPALSQIAIVGAPGERAEEPGHDLTYLAENGLVPGLELPASLYADMGGSLLVTEAVLQAALLKQRQGEKARGMYMEIALSEAARYLALPRAWGLTQAGADVGGGHAGYRVYPCKNGRVAVAALEPHFAVALCTAAGLKLPARPDAAFMRAASTHDALAQWLAGKTCAQLNRLASANDIPLHTLPGR
jgi:crotonobetainyl-CoA:carnitine CoA-transferase CaiB-like acyl-CoA transferase